MIPAAVLKVRGGKYFAMVLAMLAFQGCVSYGSKERFSALSAEVEKQISAGLATDIKIDRAEARLAGLEKLDLKTAIEIALDNNPDLQVVSTRVKEAMEKYPLVRALDDPTIGAGVYPASVVSNETDLTYKVDFRQKIPYPGKLHLKGEAALAEADALFNDFGSAKLELIRLVKTAYFELVFVYSAIGINEEDKKLLQEFKTITSDRYAAGKGNLQEVISADLDLAKVEHRQIVLGRDLDIDMARLNVLLGRAARLSIPVPSGLPETTAIRDKERVIKLALSNNPEIKAAKSRIEAGEASLKLAKLQSYPDFALSGSYNRAWANEELRPFIGISMNVPIRLGRLRAEKNIAVAKLGRAKLMLKVMQDQVRFRLEKAEQRIEEFRHAEKLFRKTIIPESELNLDAARAGYGDGKNDFLTLITAQRGLVNAQLEHKRIMVDMRIWEAKLVRSIGEE